MKSIREILYIDFEKAASLRSQFDEGMLDSITAGSEKHSAENLKAGGGIPGIISGDVATAITNIESVLETRKLHHDILTYVETKLEENNLVLDLNVMDLSTEDNFVLTRSKIETSPYIKVCGTAEFEDYARLSNIAENFPEIHGVVAESQRLNLIATSEYVEANRKLVEIKEQIKNAPKANRAILHQQRSQIEEALNDIERQVIEPPDEFGMKAATTIIKYFFANKIILKLKVENAFRNMEVLCNLKKESFTDHNLEHILYAYGVIPNVKLSVFGVVTSMPPKDEPEISDKEIDEGHKIKSAFSALNRALFDVERKFRPVIYPHIMIHPLAVYREYKLVTDKKS